MNRNEKEYHNAIASRDLSIAAGSASSGSQGWGLIAHSRWLERADEHLQNCSAPSLPPLLSNFCHIHYYSETQKLPVPVLKGENVAKI